MKFSIWAVPVLAGLPIAFAGPLVERAEYDCVNTPARTTLFSTPTSTFYTTVVTSVLTRKTTVTSTDIEYTTTNVKATKFHTFTAPQNTDTIISTIGHTNLVLSTTKTVPVTHSTTVTSTSTHTITSTATFNSTSSVTLKPATTTVATGSAYVAAGAAFSVVNNIKRSLAKRKGPKTFDLATCVANKAKQTTSTVKTDSTQWVTKTSTAHSTSTVTSTTGTVKTTTTVYPPDATTIVKTKDIHTIFSTIVVSSTSTVTASAKADFTITHSASTTATITTYQTPAPVKIYAACQDPNNLIDYTYTNSTNSVGISSFVVDSTNPKSFTATDATGCCSLCWATVDCMGSYFMGNTCVLEINESATCPLLSSGETSAEASLGSFYASGTASVAAGEGYTISNGKCGVWSYGGVA